MTPYQPLPHTPVGPHDSLEIREFPESLGDTSDIPVGWRLFWWHHADSAPAGARPKGGLCGGGSLSDHTIVGALDLEYLTIKESLLCRMCGRHIYITDGQVRDLGRAHEAA